jgi:intracellular multiplication protein IcmQ
VRDQLQVILENVEQKELHSTVTADKNQLNEELRENEMAVHVHLYNAKGIALSSWYNMLTPKVFFEYSVNRPIYAERSQIENLLKSKNNKVQHAYLIVAVKADDIIQADSGLKDSLGCPLIKIKEGSLFFDRLLAFVYNDQEYILNDKGELIRKTP